MRTLSIALLLVAASCERLPSDPPVVAERAIVEGIDVDSYAGRSLAVLGDLDGDGTTEIALGAYRREERPREIGHEPRDGEVVVKRTKTTSHGYVAIASLGADGNAVRCAELDTSSSATPIVIRDGDQFGCAMAPIGDLDGNGVSDLAIGMAAADDGRGGEHRGAITIAFLDEQARVIDAHRIDDSAPCLAGRLDDRDRFGGALAFLGDLDGDGTVELAAGAMYDDDGASDLDVDARYADGGGQNRGAVWILSLTPDGRATDARKISSTEGGFGGERGLYFGASVASLGDLDGDGTTELAVSATDVGNVWILSLDDGARVVRERRISAATVPALAADASMGNFGTALTAIDDVDGDGTIELVVGEEYSLLRERFRGTTMNEGSMWLVFLSPDGGAKSAHEVPPTISALGSAFARLPGRLGHVLVSGANIAYTEITRYGFRPPR